jgi:hypothetical protein
MAEGTTQRSRWSVRLLSVCVLGCTSQAASRADLSEDGEAVASAAQPLSLAAQAIYVVRAVGNDGYCDDVFYLGKHAEALQACIDRANTNGGGTVLLLGGSYSSGTWPLTLKSHVTLAGAGSRAAKLSPTGPTDIIGTVQDNTVIRNLAFDTSKLATGGAAIRFGSAAVAHADVKIEGNSITFATEDRGPLPREIKLYGVMASGTTLDRIGLRNNLYQVTLINNGSKHWPFFLQSTSTTAGMNDIRVEDNDVTFISLAESHAYSFNAAASVLSRGIVVSGNSLRSNGDGNMFDGVELRGNFEAQISGNHLRSSASSIYATPTSGGACNLTITGNTLYGGYSQLHGACATGAVMTGNSNNRVIPESTAPGSGKAAVLVRAWRYGSVDLTAGTKTPLPFNRVDLDNGANYDVSTNEFTAPLSGVYRVRACARLSPTGFEAGDTADISIDVDGVTWAFNRASSDGGQGDGFHSCAEDLLTLTTGATVRINVEASGAGNGKTVVGVGRYSTFVNVERVSD